MNAKALIIVLLSVSLTGCVSHQVVVLRNVPKSPSFVVIPANGYLKEVRFANEIEGAIISAGVKVVARPATKEVMDRKGSSWSRGYTGIRHPSN